VGGNTTYCCAADAFGSFVSLTHTLGGSFGSGVTVPGTGMLLNNGMYWFDPVPGRVNSVAPGKVPLNNQAETLVLEGGRPWLAIGLPGGRRILTTLTRALGLILDHAMSPAAALAAPRLHVEGREPVTFESAWKTDVPGGVDLLLDLQALGHDLVGLPVLERFLSGPSHAVWTESGQLHAAGDPRQPGAAGAL
jgi:gamma-glutamyltranspeptidase / glutathione hydrolase